MKKDPLCAKIFKGGVQVAYKRPKNIKEILCRATLPNPKKSNNRDQKGWKKCNKDKCETCIRSKNISQFQVTATKEQITINQKITCTDTNVIYCIQCTICNLQYVGKTTNKFKDRASSHRSSVDTQKNCTLSDHFNSPGHSKNNMLFFAFEKVSSNDPFTIGVRERFYIDKMNVIEHGLNKYKTKK
jgi:hypothetical protein